jgi:hypothetical protein
MPRRCWVMRADRTKNQPVVNRTADTALREAFSAGRSEKDIPWFSGSPDRSPW